MIVVEFEFPGKNSIRYFNRIKVEKPVFENLQRTDQFHSLDRPCCWVFSACFPDIYEPVIHALKVSKPGVW